MYLSSLLIDVGSDPDRPRPGRLWLRNLYRVHQRLCMAFPTKDRRLRDKEFLQPYAPDDFAGVNVHAPRSEDGGFLFRLDPRPGISPVILVQSADLPAPDWDYAFHNARYLLAAPASVRTYRPQFYPNECFRFRLRANPTKRARRGSLHACGQPMDARWVDKRIPVPASALEDWLSRRAERAGFQIIALDQITTGYIYFNKMENRGNGHRLHSVLYEGQLRVTDPIRLVEAVRAGIGSGKAFGFGLLSVARA